MRLEKEARLSRDTVARDGVMALRDDFLRGLLEDGFSRKMKRC